MSLLGLIATNPVNHVSGPFRLGSKAKNKSRGDNMRTITKLVVATALALTLAGGPTAQAQPDDRATISAAATKDAVAPAWWHITGNWEGQRTGYGRIKMRFWRTDAGVLVGNERTLGFSCTFRLTFIRKVNGVFVFQEKNTAGRCGDFRIRLQKWAGGRLKVSGGWQFEEVLHRP